MTWTSVHHLVEDLGLEANPYDLQAIRKELKNQLTQLHPDRSGGKFPSEAHEREYHRYAEALEYLESQGGMLVPVAAATELVRQVTETVATLTRQPVEERILKATADHQANIKQQFRMPKISLGAISAALGYVLLFPQQFAEHPFLRELLYWPRMALWWGVAVYVLAVLWLWTWILERQLKAQVNRVFSLAHHRAVLEAVKGKEGPVFSRSALQGHLDPRQPKPLPRRALLPRNIGVDLSVLERATDLAIERYLERGWIRRVQPDEMDRSHGVDEWFRILV